MIPQLQSGTPSANTNIPVARPLSSQLGSPLSLSDAETDTPDTEKMHSSRKDNEKNEDRESMFPNSCRIHRLLHHVSVYVE
jgi:hypothetical protein